MPVVKTKTFRSGNSEAIRLPKEVAFGEGVELTIVRSGDVMTIYPTKKRSLEDMFEQLEKLPGPGMIEERDVEEIPERDGL